jgi:hypothetical protein
MLSLIILRKHYWILSHYFLIVLDDLLQSFWLLVESPIIRVGLSPHLIRVRPCHEKSVVLSAIVSIIYLSTLLSLVHLEVIKFYFFIIELSPQLIRLLIVRLVIQNHQIVLCREYIWNCLVIILSRFQ